MFAFAGRKIRPLVPEGRTGQAHVGVPPGGLLAPRQARGLLRAALRLGGQHQPLQ